MSYTQKKTGNEPASSPNGESLPGYVRPTGVDAATIDAVGRLSEALEITEQARGMLYGFHRLTGAADLALGEAVEMLRAANHTQLANWLQTELVGRNVLPGRWTFQVVDDYDDTYYGPFRDAENRVRHQLVEGLRHLHEAAMKQRRRTPDHPHHSATPTGDDCGQAALGQP